MKNNLIIPLAFCVFHTACMPVVDHKVRDAFEPIDCGSFRRLTSLDISDVIEVNKETLELTESTKKNLSKVIKNISQCNVEQINVVVFYNTNFRIEFDETSIISENIKLFIEKNAQTKEKITWDIRYLAGRDLINNRLVYLEVLPKNCRCRVGIRKSEKVFLPRY